MRMARVRGSGNVSTELKMIALLRNAGITGWRRGAPLPGKPDFVFRAQKVALFVDGCFWHGCPRHRRTPKSRLDFWTVKLARNAQRDRAVTRALRASGWTVLRVWECALARSRAGRTVARIVRALAATAPKQKARPIERPRLCRRGVGSCACGYGFIAAARSAARPRRTSPAIVP